MTDPIVRKMMAFPRSFWDRATEKACALGVTRDEYIQRVFDTEAETEKIVASHVLTAENYRADNIRLRKICRDNGIIL